MRRIKCWLFGHPGFHSQETNPGRIDWDDRAPFPRTNPGGVPINWTRSRCIQCGKEE